MAPHCFICLNAFGVGRLIAMANFESHAVQTAPKDDASKRSLSGREMLQPFSSWHIYILKVNVRIYGANLNLVTR